jgi:hypothetical protein
MGKRNKFSKKKFENDLAQGRDAEDYICGFLHRWFPSAFVFVGKNKEYDIDIPEKEEKMEVKYDRLSKETGNVAIEFAYCDKPSGIEATIANRWCIVFGKEDGWFFAFIDIDILKGLCSGKRVVNGGDGNMSKMYLVPVVDLLEHPFIKIHPLIK